MKYLIEDGYLAEVYPPFEKDEVVPDGPEYIGEAVFACCKEKTKIVSIVIPDSVIEIEEDAFSGCTKLSSVKIGKGIKKIAKNAFAKCSSLKDVQIETARKKVKIHPGAFPKTANVVFSDDLASAAGKPNYDMRLTEAKKKYTISKRQAGYSINDFSKGWRIMGPYGPDWAYDFYDDVTDKRITIPETLDGNTVCHVAVKTIPADAIVLCSATQFGKLGRAQKTSTTCGWLRGIEGFQEDEVQAIGKFAKSYAEDVARRLAGEGDANAFARFIDLAKPKAAVLQTVLDELTVDPETKALLMDRLGTSAKSEPIANFDSKPMTAAELKKLWTMQTVTDGATEEKYIDLRNYKGSSGEVVVPAFVGKTPVREFSCVMPAHVTKIVFETHDIKIKGSFRNCKSLADENGFIVIHEGGRSILTDYIGPKDIEVLTVPEGVTESCHGAFDEINMRIAKFPKGFQKFADYTFRDCELLQEVYLSDGLMEIGDLFYGCYAVKALHIPKSVESIYHMNCPNLTIYAPAGSYAEQYAKEHDIPFVAE